MLLDLKAMRESLGLTPVKRPEKVEMELEERSEDDCYLLMRTPDEKEEGRRPIQAFS